MALLVGKMLYLQTYRHEYLYAKSESNRIRVQPVTPRRGIIYDRDRRPLVANRAAYTLSVVPAEAAKTVTVQKLSTLLAIDEAELQRRVRKTP